MEKDFALHHTNDSAHLSPCPRIDISLLEFTDIYRRKKYP